jgi:hypothetical protein
MKAKISFVVALACAALILPLAAHAAATDSSTVTPKTIKAPAAGTVPMTMKEVKQKLGLSVYPAKNQSPEQQDKDEYDCLLWAADQAGIKPGQTAPDSKAAGDAAAAKVDSAAAGAAVKGAAKGAAAGAIVGAISGDAGTGAAIGAGAGAVAGRRAKKKAKADASTQAEQKVEADKKAKMEEVKKGMAACLESKGYTVK